MELQLKKEKYFHYEPLGLRKEAQEETVETLIPDYYAEVSRVVDASGCLYVEKSEVNGAQVSVSASVMMTLLYTSQEEKELKSFTYHIPLQTNISVQDADLAKCNVCGALQMSEVQVVNPRKLTTHLVVQWQSSCYEEAWIPACSQIEEQTEYGIETLCRDYDMAMIEAVREQEFSFSDSFALNSDEAQSILKSSTIVRVDEAKALGSKVVIKGTVCADVLYETADNRILHSTAQLPFSQIIEGIEAPEEEIRVEANACPVSAQYGIESEDFSSVGRSINAKISMRLFVLIRRKRQICAIADLYSTRYDLESENENVLVSSLPQYALRDVPVEVSLEVGTASKPLCAEVKMGEVSQSLNVDGTIQCRSNAEVRLIYCDESGMPFSVVRRQEVVFSLESGENLTVSACRIAPCDIAVTMQDDIAVVKFTARFSLFSQQQMRYFCLRSVRAEEHKSEENMPSLVLRVLREGEKLWDIAKQYRTTMQDILDANDVEQWQDLIGKLLLIPHS